MPADVKKARELASKLLLSQRLYSFPVEIKSLSYEKNIVFDSFSGFCSKTLVKLNDLTGFDAAHDGCTIIKKRNGGTIYIILYNDEGVSPVRRNFTLAHEIGHIYLGHETDDIYAETEANYFAAQLLLPSSLVWELLTQSGFTLTPDELSVIFAVSKSASQICLNSLSRYSRSVFSETEQLLVKKFGGLLPQLNGPLISL